MAVLPSLMQFHLISCPGVAQALTPVPE